MKNRNLIVTLLQVPKGETGCSFWKRNRAHVDAKHDFPGLA